MEASLRKYIYLWIDKYRNINDFDASQGYLFDDLGINLSSEYNVSHTFKKNEKGKNVLELKIKKNDDYEESFYSDCIQDVKVLVGNNGVGKTSLMRIVSNIISGKESYDFQMNFVLVYVQNNTVYRYVQHKDYKKQTYDVEIVESPLNWDLAFVEDVVAPLTIFYSPSFNGNEYMFKALHYRDGEKYLDISTDGLLTVNKEKFVNPKSYAREYYNQGDSLFYYSMIEQNSLIDFMINAGSEFYQILKVPQKIKMEPSMQAIDYALSDLAVKIVQDQKNPYDTIVNNMDGEIQIKWLEMFEKSYRKWKEESNDKYSELSREVFVKEKKFDYDKESIIEAVKDSWLDFYGIIKNLGDCFRFAALMSYTRTFYQASHVKEVDSRYDEEYDLKINLKMLKKEYEEKKSLQEASFWSKEQTKKDIKIIHEQIEQIILYYDRYSSGYENNLLGFVGKDSKYLGNGYVIFDLKEHGDKLLKVRQTYNEIYKLTDFISFGFTRPLSSGENQFIRFFSRIYTALKDPSIDKPVHSIHLFVDEGELYLHPEWQRCWLDVFIKLMATIELSLRKVRDNKNDDGGDYVMDSSQPLRIQLFIATHSPFMLTDFNGSNIIKLQRKKDEDGNRFGKVVCVNEKINSFAGNIYDILKEGFFLEGTLGYRTERKLKDLIRNIEKGEVYSETLISQIGDPILKALILQKKGDSNDKNKN